MNPLRRAASTAPALPAGWTAHVSKSSGQTYYKNAVGESRWKAPAAAPAARAPAARISAQVGYDSSAFVAENPLRQSSSAVRSAPRSTVLREPRSCSSPARGAAAAPAPPSGVSHVGSSGSGGSSKGPPGVPRNASRVAITVQGADSSSQHSHSY